MKYKKYWIALAVVIIGSFAVLGGVGYQAISQASPIPQTVATTDGRVLFDGNTIQNGQNVWQSIGGQEIGSIWGHGAYVAPDWSADWLHREAVFILDRWAAQAGGKDYASLPTEQQSSLRGRLTAMMRANTYDPTTGRLTIEPVRAEAFEILAKHYADVFSQGRKEYAIQKGALTDPTKLHEMATFFWWTSWSASTNRPGTDVSYTNNWPHEPLIGNVPTSSAVVWSFISVIMLLAGIGALVWYFSAKEKEPMHGDYPKDDPLLGLNPTPSQRATIKFFFVAAALMLVQILLGIITAHYGVEGDGFYGIPLDKWLPYSITRTWHTQIGIFWIATSWLATGLFVAPAVSGYEPKGRCGRKR